MQTLPEIPAVPDRTIREVFTSTVSGSVDYPTADAAWRLVLDAWRVIDVASARASVPPTPTRDEWMAALRLASFRLDHDVTEPPQPCGLPSAWDEIES